MCTLRGSAGSARGVARARDGGVAGPLFSASLSCYLSPSWALSLSLRERLVSDVVADGAALAAAAAALAAEMLGAAPEALRLTKEVLQLAADTPSLDAALALEDRQQALAAADPGFAARLAAVAAGGCRATAVPPPAASAGE